jgi:hypothetical protein
LAVSGSPVLFAGTVALAGVAISSITKDVHLNPAMLWVLLVVLAVLLGLQMTAEYRRRTYDPTWMFKFDEDFNSDDMRHKRSKAAEDIKNNQTRLTDDDFKSPELDDVLDFFEGVGFLMQGDEMTPEVAHHAFHYWIHGYYVAAREYIETTQNKRPMQWECVKGLFELTSEVEDERRRKLAKSEEPLDGTCIAKFLEEEIALAV